MSLDIGFLTTDKDTQIKELSAAGLLNMRSNSVGSLQIKFLTSRRIKLIDRVTGGIARDFERILSIEIKLAIFVVVESCAQFLHLLLGDIEGQLATQPDIAGVPASVDNHVIETRHSKASLASLPRGVIKVFSLPSLTRVSGGVFPSDWLHVSRGQNIFIVINIAINHLTVSRV